MKTALRGGTKKWYNFDSNLLAIHPWINRLAVGGNPVEVQVLSSAPSYIFPYLLKLS